MNGEFRAFLDGLPAESRPNVTLRGADDHPVTGVTWTEASLFCQSLSKQLPTEAQWEYAARGGDRREFPWGDATPTALHANFCESKCPDRAPVDSHEPGRSAQGVYHLAGNAAEWVQDAFDRRFYEKSVESNPVNERLNRDKERVVRGGSYAHGPYFLRAATRNYRPAQTRDPTVGFRCARSTSASS